MNKFERRLKGYYKFKKRLKNVGFTTEELKKANTNLYAYKTSGKPCSCYMCRNEKYTRNIKHKKLKHEQ